MAYVYFLGSKNRGEGKTYVAQKLGLEFPVQSAEDFPPVSRTAQLINEGNNVVFTACGDNIDHLIVPVTDHAKAAGTILIFLGIMKEGDFRE